MPVPVPAGSPLFRAARSPLHLSTIFDEKKLIEKRYFCQKRLQMSNSLEKGQRTDKDVLLLYVENARG